MLYDKPLNCICNKSPQLKTKPIGGDYKYYYYECGDCNISTFSTRLEEFCRELWNAAIFYKLNSIKK
jgi:hypothetical protein